MKCNSPNYIRITFNESNPWKQRSMKNRIVSFPSFLAQCLVVVVEVDGRWRENGKSGLQCEALFVRHGSIDNMTKRVCFEQRGYLSKRSVESICLVLRRAARRVSCC
ncbi:hypothetical protein Droror1_Dr00007114 [Drosera rotundifolia]